MIRRAGCAELAELRSAFVDSALADRDREFLLSHLVDCPACRAEVEDLRRVRRLLAMPEQTVAAPADLSSRLISISATQSPAPRPIQLPKRLLAAGTSLVVGLSCLAVVGFVTAPPLTEAVAGDPSAEAVNEFGGLLASLPLTNQSVDAVAAIQPTRLDVLPTPRTTTPSGVARELGARQARARLEAAARTPNRLSFSGVQTYRAVRGDTQIAAGVSVVNVAGEGMEQVVHDSGGRDVQSRFVRENAASRLNDLTLVGLLARHYDLSGWPGSEVAGRRATVIEARTDGRLAARWWVDDATALMLWLETYDPRGRVQSSVGFTRVEFGDAPFRSEHPQSTAPRTTASLTLAKAGDLARQGWSPPRTLAGLPLVRLRADRLPDPQVVHLVYSDGLSVVSVLEQRGGLTGAPPVTRWDDRLDAFVRWGAPAPPPGSPAGPC